MRQYTESQIANAKAKYERFMQPVTPYDFEIRSIGMTEAHNRAEDHNRIVERVKNGDKDTIRFWKLHFLNQEFEADRKASILAAAREVGKNNIAAIKSSGKKMGDYYTFLKNHKKYAREFYSKKYTAESVSEFLSL